MADRRTLDELDPPAWGSAEYESHLVRRTHELRRKATDDFTIEDLRMPRAVAVLERNPLAQGDFFPGDLLRAVLDVDVAYWQDHQDHWLRVHAVVDGLLSAMEELRKPIDAFRRLTQL